MSKLGYYNKTKGSAIGDVYIFIYAATIVISALVSLFYGILGIIAYKKYGFYPASSDVWKVITKGIKNTDYEKVDSAIEMLVNGKLMIFILALMLIRLILAQLGSRGFIGKVLCILSDVGLVYYLYDSYKQNQITHTDPLGDKMGIVIAAFLLINIIAGMLGHMLISLGVLIFHIAAVPFIMYLFQIGFKKVILAILGFILVFVLLSKWAFGVKMESFLDSFKRDGFK